MIRSGQFGRFFLANYLTHNSAQLPTQSIYRFPYLFNTVISVDYKERVLQSYLQQTRYLTSLTWKVFNCRPKWYLV